MLFIASEILSVKKYSPAAYNEYGLKLLFRGKQAQPVILNEVKDFLINTYQAPLLSFG